MCYKETVQLLLIELEERWIKMYNVNNSTHYDLLSIVLQNNSSIIIDWIGGKIEKKYIMWTIVHIMSYSLLCFKITVQLLLIELDKKIH